MTHQNDNTYPVHLSGSLDPNLSRGPWLDNGGSETPRTTTPGPAGHDLATA